MTQGLANSSAGLEEQRKELDAAIAASDKQTGDQVDGALREENAREGVTQTLAQTTSMFCESITVSARPALADSTATAPAASASMFIGGSGGKDMAASKKQRAYLVPATYAEKKAAAETGREEAAKAAKAKPRAGAPSAELVSKTVVVNSSLTGASMTSSVKIPIKGHGVSGKSAEDLKRELDGVKRALEKPYEGPGADVRFENDLRAGSEIAVAAQKQAPDVLFAPPTPNFSTGPSKKKKKDESEKS